MIFTNLLPVKFSSTKALEFFSAELADNVLHALVLEVSELANEEWSHGIYFVLEKIFPVFTVEVASMTVVMNVRVAFVPLHIFFIVKGLVAVLVSTFDLVVRRKHSHREETGEPEVIGERLPDRLEGGGWLCGTKRYY